MLFAFLLTLWTFFRPRRLVNPSTVVTEGATFERHPQPVQNVDLREVVVRPNEPRSSARLSAGAALVTALATLVLTFVTWRYVELTNRLVQLQIDPSLALSIADPLHRSNELVLKNTGAEPIKNISVNLRCFVFENSLDTSPVTFFEGFEAIGEDHSWWHIAELRSGQVLVKDGASVFSGFIQNGELILKDNQRLRLASTHPPAAQKSSRAQLPLFSNFIVVVDVKYQRAVDLKTYRLSRPVWLMKDQNGRPILDAVPISTDFRSVLKQLAGSD
jgi:hypothetical protein